MKDSKKPDPWLSFRIPREMRDALVEQAKKNGNSLSGEARRLLRDSLGFLPEGQNRQRVKFDLHMVERDIHRLREEVDRLAKRQREIAESPKKRMIGKALKVLEARE